MPCKDAQADNQFNLINKNNKLHLIFGFHNAGVGGSSPPMTTIFTSAAGFPKPVFISTFEKMVR